MIDQGENTIDTKGNLEDAGSQTTRRNSAQQRVIDARADAMKRRKQLRILRMFGTVNFDPSYDYKAERRKN
jgi:hypothetical protein